MDRNPNPRELLDEYVDGLLSEEQRALVEAALAEDPALRAELASVRDFAELVSDLPADPAEDSAVRRIVSLARDDVRRRGRILRWATGIAAAAALLLIGVWLGRDEAEPPPRDRLAKAVADNARVFGQRLGDIARTRREGRVPRVGTGDLEVPPAAAMGLVFDAALSALGVDAAPELRPLVRRTVREHYEHTVRLASDLEGEMLRSEASLRLYRRLRDLGGGDLATAWYDVFRPGLAHLDTVRRLRAGTMALVLRETAPAQAEAYVRRYEHALARLQDRYGRPRLDAVLARLAPRDRRDAWSDATQDGVPPDTILQIRASMYRTAFEAGVDRLYVDF